MYGRLERMSFLKEFKEFAVRGNVIDMAFGIIIGAAFGKIVTSLVGDVLMPLIGIFTVGIDFTSLSAHIGDAEIRYGQLIQHIFDFIIIAFCIFLMIQAINRFNRKKEKTVPPAAEPTPSPEEILLTEIRDLLKKE